MASNIRKVSCGDVESIFFTTVAPVGLIIRLTGKDLLQHNLNSEIKSYWVER